MKPMKKLALLLCLSLLLTQCQLFGKKDPEPELPAATQEGKNTFGCKVNGKVWLPKGRSGTRSSLNLVYDPYFYSGTLSINAFRKEDNNVNYQYIILGLDSLSKAGTYSLTTLEREILYYDRNVCDYTDPSSASGRGILTINRLDLQKGIIAGTFEFTLIQPNCDTIHVTEGRFDKKL